MDKLALTQLAQMVYDYCGLNYLANLTSLEMKIDKRINQLNLSSLWSYIRLLQSEESEWDILVEILTINETYFYREDKQLTAFQVDVLTELIERDEPIQVWSAACSTGEEAYSLAIMANQLMKNKPFDINIYATDINKKVLAIGESATYNKRSLSFRRIPQYWLDFYFDETASSYIVKKELRDIVQFEHLNLFDINKKVEKETYDVIFCRNVLIYFDDETIKKIIKDFHASLKPGGYLFLGHAETISNWKLGFETINRNGTFYYRKES